ncbi:MAG: serine hydrolase [Chloroflexota bacterium]
MRARGGFDWLRWISIGLLLLALILFFFELLAYSRSRAKLPEGLTIAGVPVGRLEKEEALDRLLQVYSMPVELHYDDQIILLNPATVGFRLDTEGMMAAAELARSGPDFWEGFWDFLWNRPGDAESIPLRAEHSRTQLQAALADIAARYDQPPIPAQPVPGSPTFVAGLPGRMLDLTRAAELVETALNAPVNRRVRLPVAATGVPRPTLETLETLLKQNIDVAGFTGLTAIYLMDLRTGEEMRMAYLNGQDIPLDPDISFTAESIIKIPIMVTFYRYFDEPFDTEAERWMSEMIRQSGNDPADWLMDRLDGQRGPLVVTDTMRELGLQNTFMIGYFRPPFQPLAAYPRSTPGNTRFDINTRPDLLNQTSPAEIGRLLADIYQCADGGGTLLAVFPEQTTPQECRRMLDLLAQNKIGVLIEGGVPDGTRVAHKHGWATPLESIGDAAIVFSPAGDYVLSIFVWNEPAMIWDPASRMIADLSTAVYNYFNPPSQ